MTVNQNTSFMRFASKSSENSSTFKTPSPGATTTFKPLSSETNNSDAGTGSNFEMKDYMSDQGQYSKTENIEQYTEKSINRVTLLGRVGIDPQLRGTESHPVVAFSLATNIQYRPGGVDSSNSLVKKTEWHNITVFRPHLRDSVHNYVTKGSRVMVQGRIMYGTIEDKQGNLRSTTSIVADDVIRFA